ncbi:MAG: benzoate/H(+) symporter BenE family transporter [Burkholderiaceae bacterium]
MTILAPSTPSSRRPASARVITLRASPRVRLRWCSACCSPAFTSLMLHAPKVFIMALAGLAMLRVLQSAFMASFKDKPRWARWSLFWSRWPTSSPDGNIGAAFWGMVAGIMVSWLLERHDFG